MFHLTTLFVFLLAHAIPAIADDKSIFILAGQSNMAGRGGVVNDKWDRVVPPECQPSASVLRLSAGLRWEEASEPLHADIDRNKTCGIGPGLVFANAVLGTLRSSVGLVGLVPCAVGGTKISEWAQGTRLYSQLVARAKASLSEGGTIRAILWYQGESDTVSRADAESYKGNLGKLILDLRSDLRSPTLPVIQVALASGSGPLVGMVRKAQLGLDLPSVWTVDAMGLPLEPDGLHLTTAGQVRLGTMLAQAYVKMVHSQKQSKPVALFSSSATNKPQWFVVDFLIRPFCRFLGRWRDHLVLSYQMVSCHAFLVFVFVWSFLQQNIY